MLAIFALAGFLFIPGFFNRDMWDAQLRAPTDAVDDQHVKLTQKTVNGILLVFPGWVGKCIERSSLTSRRLWCGRPAYFPLVSFHRNASSSAWSVTSCVSDTPA